MKHVRNVTAWLGMVLAILSVAALGGCQQATSAPDQPAPQAAVVTVFYDGSSSTAFVASPAYAEAAVKKVGQAVMDQRLGDEFRIVPFGSRTTDRSVAALSIASGYKLRLASARKQVESSLSGLLEQDRQTGGDGTTNLLYSLENAHPTCTSRSRIIILSDGIEESEAYSAGRALMAGRPVHLPSPGSAYLKGCSVMFIGIGVSPMGGSGQTAETLPSKQLASLISGWRIYLESAGVSPADMSFTSIL
ncbi:MAG: hypothetical protein ACOY45_04565 [Pseudomonadota bacterium]